MSYYRIKLASLRFFDSRLFSVGFSPIRLAVKVQISYRNDAVITSKVITATVLLISRASSAASGHMLFTCSKDCKRFLVHVPFAPV